MGSFVRFEDGVFWAEAFDTPLGPVELDATVAIRGKTLLLKEFALQPLDQPMLRLNTSGLRSLRRHLLLLAAEEGYTEVVISGERVTGKSPGRAIHYTRRTL